MINFSSLTNFQIPEGKVTALAIDGNPVWTAEKWDIEWKYDGSRPSTSVWTYPQGTSLIQPSSSMNAVKFSAPTSNDVALIELNTTKYPANNNCVFEIEFNIDVIGYDYPGIHFVLTGPVSNGEARALRCNAAIGTGEAIFIEGHNKTKQISGDAWHTLRLELNTTTGKNRIYLDKVLLCEVNNSNLDYYYEGEGAHFWTRECTCYVRALRYRKGT